ncbi:MAG: hypothetical protein ABJE95_19550 [Byssovorax sp.]
MSLLSSADRLVEAQKAARETEAVLADLAKTEGELAERLRVTRAQRDRAERKLVEHWRAEEQAYDVCRIDKEKARADELKRREALVPSTSTRSS